MIIDNFIKSVENYPDHPALVVDDTILTYRELEIRSNKIARAIKENEKENSQVASVLAYRSETAYTGILGILLSEKGYVPLNPKFPVERTVAMQDLSKSCVIVVGKECMSYLKLILPKIKIPQLVILSDSDQKSSLQKDFSEHEFISLTEVVFEEKDFQKPNVNLDSIAYLLFTSGSTGIPKGVPVSHGNVASYVDYICQAYEINSNDRFSQVFDLTFDLSVHDMFVCWSKGACLYCVPSKYVMAPAKFIKEKELTAWFSVPSTGMFMSKMGMLKENAFPSLRYSLFCGEPLPISIAEKWQKAAPNSVLENLYGPTEATVAITRCRLDGNNIQGSSLNGVVSIGQIFETQKYCIIDDKNHVVNNSETGELCLSGSQITSGYLDDLERTKQQYIKIDKLGDDIWYKTGDLVKEDENKCLFYLERVDSQVQIRGYRVELQEVNRVLKTITSEEIVYSIAWPQNGGIAQGIDAFICTENKIDESKILKACKDFLPDYMIPASIHVIDDMPLNTSGKVDRSRLLDMLKSGKV